MRATSLLAAAACASSAAASFCAPSTEWVPAWADEFDGTSIDAASWNVLNASDLGSCRDAWCTPDAVAVRGGALILTTDVAPPGGLHGHNWTSGAVNTQGKRSWAPSPWYRVCVSAILPGGASPSSALRGVWPAHWMMPDVAGSCWPDAGEQDIMEMIDGGQGGPGGPNTVFATYHWSNAPGVNCSGADHSQHGEAQVPAWRTQFQEFALERGPNHLAFATNGVVTINITNATAAFFQVPFYAILNTAIGGSWPGEPNASTALPVHHVIDYVRVVTRAE